MKKTKIFIDTGITLKFLKMKSAEKIESAGNSERFARVLGGQIILLCLDNNRVYARYNPHIAQQLRAERVEGYRIDSVNICYEALGDSITGQNSDITADFDKMKASAPRGFVVCGNCGRTIRKTQRVGAFCENCLTNDNGLATYYGYHNYYGGYTPKKHYERKTAIFGCEIERDYTGDGNASRDRKEALLQVVKCLYGKRLENKTCQREFVFMRDGSLRQDGVEWITFPYSYNDYKNMSDRLQKAIEIFKNYNFENSNNVGNHIHINRDFFENSKYAAAKMSLIMSMFWKEFCAIAKRHSTDYTSKPSQNATDDIYTIVEKTINTRGDHSIAINQQHGNTIEIRIWGGIDNANDLLLFIDLTQALALYVKKYSLEKCQKAKFCDILKFLTDKSEHLPEIKSRLNAKRIREHDNAILSMIEGLKKKETTTSAGEPESTPEGAQENEGRA